MGDRRIAGLDGLRGLAALTVVLTHALVTFPSFWQAISGGDVTDRLVWALAYSPAHLVWAGHEAVLLFFVLSGFVLALPFVDGRAPSYPAFVIRRIWRVYVPYFVVTVVAAGLATVLAGPPIGGLSDWFHVQWNRTSTMSDVLDIARMSGSSGDIFNSPSWSLVFEVRLSLVVPILALLARRLSFPIAGGLALLLAGIAGAAVARPGFEPMVDALRTAQYSGVFLAGATLARHRQLVVATWLSMPLPSRTGIILAGLALYLGNWLLHYPQLGLSVALGDVPISIGACILVAAALAEPGLRGVLTARACYWLGRISFSLYLCHVPVLLAIIHGFGRAISPVALVVLFPAVALLCAEIVHRLVEEPSRRLGRRLGSRLDGSDSQRFLNVRPPPSASPRDLQREPA